jgi:carnitine 3-dehydrogenase
MGLFETYRVAGGEAGMRHFIAQFGPCLSWPWTRLTDVPELDEALIDKIASQSDAQSGMHSIRELERIRDDNLVAMMRALKGRDWASGHLLREHDARLRSTQAEPDWAQPVETLVRTVPIDWTDYNGHMNEARYLEAFSGATDRFMELVGCDAAYIASGGSYFTVETHIKHLTEVPAGARIRATTQLLDGAGKRMHLLNRLYGADGQLLATAEHLLLHVSLATRRASLPGPALQQKLSDVQAKHAALPRPERIYCGIRD